MNPKTNLSAGSPRHRSGYCTNLCTLYPSQEFNLMRKLFILSLVILATSISVPAQNPPAAQNPEEPPNMGLAPKAENGIGRADVRVFAESGNPIRNASVKLESTRTDGYFCETDWFPANEKGVVVLPPLHMGRLKFKVRAQGYHSRNLKVMAASLSQPVRATL